MNKPILYLTVSLALFACQNQQKETENTNEKETSSFNIQTDLQHQVTPPQRFKINAVEGQAIKTKDGSHIIVPTDAFVDMNGNPIKGEVNISYQPIKGASNIIASGIPMVYETNGKQESFVSDGMFDLRAYANGEEAKLASGKKIDVHMPSKDQTSDFDFWFFNEKEGNWENRGQRAELTTNEEINKSIASEKIPSLDAGPENQKLPEDPKRDVGKPTFKPCEYDPNKQVIEIDFNEESFPELAEYSQFMWQYAGTKGDLDPEKNKWIYKGDWEKVELKSVKNNPFLYTLAFEVEGKPFKTKVTPALSGKDYEKAKESFRKNIAKLEAEVQDIKNGKADDKARSILYNSFTVNQMGIYNCDRFYSDPSASKFEADFLFDNKKLNEDQMIYIILNNKEDVIQYNARNYELKIKPKVVDAIITVAGGGAVAAVAPEYMAEFKKRDGGKIKLLFKKVRARLTNSGSLDQLISEL